MRLVLSLLLLATGQVSAQATPQPEAEGSVRVVVHDTRAGLVDRLLGGGFAARAFPPSGVGLVAAEVTLGVHRLPALHRLVGKNNVIVLERSQPMRDVVAAWRRAAPEAPDTRYYTPAEIIAELDRLQRTYPGLARRYDLNARYSVGLTHGGRRIHALRISDNPGVDEDEPAALLVTNHHARELNTTVAALYAAGQLLAGYATDPRIKQLIDGHEIWIVPTMNPDGLQYVWTTNNFWRKNRRRNSSTSYGVDLNRNYPYFWARCGSSTNPGSETYHGPGAASEPETKVMLALGRAEVFERVLDVHSYGRDVRYGYNRLTGPRLPPGLKRYLDRIQGEVATAMSYRVNASCCCGGDQHWHFAENGSLAYLVEMGTGFQPAWSSTQSEVQRVWRGVEAFLLRPVPLRGHVRSLAGGKPLAAEVEVVGQPLRDGQKRRSSPRHGRYAVWLDTGTYQLRFTAPGHEPRALTVSVVDGRTRDLDVLLTPAMTPATLTRRGTPRLGGSAFFDLRSPDDGGREYLVLAALGDTPGIRVGPRTVPLNSDPLLNSMTSLGAVFVNAFGRLSSSGQGTMTFRVPAVPAFHGLRLFFCGLTLDARYPVSVKAISNGLAVTLTR